jgi:hypothetical protein
VSYPPRIPREVVAGAFPAPAAYINRKEVSDEKIVDREYT